jgi:hypothetical protein
VVISADRSPCFRACQFAEGFGNGAFGMRPFWFNAIEPGTLARQLNHQATAPGVLDSLVMCLHPGPHGPADVPRGVITNHQERLRDVEVVMTLVGGKVVYKA